MAVYRNLIKIFVLAVTIYISGTTFASLNDCRALLQESSSILKMQKRRFDTANEQNNLKLEEYFKTLNEISKSDPDFKKVFDLLQSKNTTFAIDRHPETRESLVALGFLNIHETGTSAGAARAEFRAFVEAQYLGLSQEEYEKLPVKTKPKSMYLIPQNTDIEAPPTHYYEGKGDTWIFKRAFIEDNVRFVVGDSYDRALNVRLLTDPPTGIPNMTFHMKGDSILDYVLPLELLWIATPYYYGQVKNENSWRFVDLNSSLVDAYYEKQVEEFLLPPNLVDFSELYFNDEFFKKFPKLNAFQDSYLERPYGNYVEGLYYGELDIDKVEAFIFREKPPKAEFVELLKSKGIKVIDGRSPK